MYCHIMSLRRISTPLDLGAAVRDGRNAARLTQAELASRAGVSREWLIGLERGARPRAEFTKILAVLAALDQPFMLGDRGPEGTVKEGTGKTQRQGAESTAELTRRAIERTQYPGTAAALAAALAAPETGRVLAEANFPSTVAASLQEFARQTGALPRPDFSGEFIAGIASAMSKLDGPSLVSKADFSALMPQPDPALLRLVQEIRTTGGRLSAEFQRDGEEHGEATSSSENSSRDVPGPQDTEAL